jgi:hypothetical protein
MMTPVEYGSTSPGLQPRSRASSPQTRSARFIPSAPVPALALPVFTTSARTLFRRFFLQISTGAAQNRLRVKTPATLLPGARRMTSRSRRLGFLMPAMAAPSSSPETGCSAAGSGGGRFTAMPSSPVESP